MKKTLYSEQHQILLEMLKTAREDSGLTQIELAKSLRFSQSDISKCERGVRRLDVVELHAWCDALGISFRAFVSDFDARLSALEARRQAPTARRRSKQMAK